MNADKLQQIQAEVNDQRTSAKKPQETFAYKLFRQAYKLAIIWSWFAVLAFIVQATILAFIDSAVFIPGIAQIFLGAAGLSIVLVGGEEAIDGVKSFKGGSGATGSVGK